jgi:eukaryotic-like serine/threonine-protein kinase
VQNLLKQIERTLFEGALDLHDPEVREAFLAQSCNGNPALRARLEKLLDAQPQAESFFDINILQAVSSDESEGEDAQRTPLLGEPGPEPHLDSVDDANAWIGRYRLVRRLGDGGCGVVYAAEQQEPVQREVALKVIRLGMNTERVIARFDIERRALALMNHPNIAHVLDAGATKSGMPYFVMELVPGTKITQYCDEHRLNTAERLELFIQVCLAIQHAHQKGVLHLDIKPSNVLITQKDGAPAPKVIDFGIGKAIEGPLADGAASVISDQFIGTPAYMSPEQASGQEVDIDTRSDIYSLGALLYELLAGRPPFDAVQLMESGVDEMRSVLKEQEPPLPSAVLRSLDGQELAAIAERRRSKPLALISSLSSDLDWVVKRAMEKDRQRRYATANGLAADVRRYLQKLPVSAHPTSRIYTLRKLVRRNRLAFFSAAVVTFTLVSGLSTSTWLFFREREAREHEARLLAEAEDAERLSRAVFLTRERDFDAADKLLKQIKTPLTTPSLDAVSAYRTIGNQFAQQGRWREAADHFLVLLQLDGMDFWKSVATDYLSCGDVLIECGDSAGYDKFRQAAISQLSKTQNLDGQQTILKICLLIAPDKNLLQQLQLFADNIQRNFDGLDPKIPATWGAIPVSLWRYRTGDYEGAIKLAQRGYAESDTISAHNAAVRLIMAMALAQKGQMQAARLQYDAARGTIDARFRGAPGAGDSRSGYWYDWVFAHILLREAGATIGQ